MEQLRVFGALLTRRDGAARALERGRWPVAVLAVGAACAIAALNASRVAASTSVGSLVYGPDRSPAIPLLLDTVGTARTAVLVYLLERIWPWLLVLSALTPVLVWLLGSTAVHASAAFFDARRPFGRFFVFFGYAAAAALVPAGLATYLLEGDERSVAAALGRILVLVLYVWLAVAVYRGVRAYYGVASGRAGALLVVAIGLFYLAPIVLILLTVAALVVAAMLLRLA